MQGRYVAVGEVEKAGSEVDMVKDMYLTVL